MNKSSEIFYKNVKKQDLKNWLVHFQNRNKLFYQKYDFIQYIILIEYQTILIVNELCVTDKRT